MSGHINADSVNHELREISRLMRAGDWAAARDRCHRLNIRAPQVPDAWLATSQAAMALKDAPAALAAVEHAVEIDPSRVRYAIQRAQCLLALGRRTEALASAETAMALAGKDAGAFDAIGTLRSFAADQSGALQAYDRAVGLAPEESQFAFNRASVRRFLGDLEGAEADYDRAIAHRPLDFEAYFNRSDLRVQTADRNHVAELQALSRRPDLDWRGFVQIHYALAKECEDLGRHAEAFEHLRQGARKRREHLRYDVSVDVETAEWVAQAYAKPSPEPAPETSIEQPIFVVGLPRSGTTLVERILASHSAMTSAGELDSFARCLVEAARAKSGRTAIPRRELVALSATLDFAALGQAYIKSAREVVDGTGRFIDKMPLNYLYCGLIRRALPRARIVHVVRHPMAVCYAMYKTLFKSGYPFSYDLREIAKYYGAYSRLMAHWRASLPGAIYDIRYEDLVADQAGESRRLLAHCGLEWEEGCLAFHRNPSPSTTASASQVRRPVYNSSVSQWQNYSAELRELKNALAAEGIDMPEAQS